jgi:exopolysaccharide production protein ExoZ
VAIGLVLGYTGNAIATFYTSGILMEFVWGCLVFLAFDRYPGVLKTLSPLWLAGLAALVAQNFYEVPLPREIERGLPAALIVMSVVGLEIKDGPLQRTFSRIGDASYSLYLGHLYMLAVVTRSVIALLGTSVLSAAIAGVFSVLVSIAFAMLCFYLLERPANAWIRRLTMPRRGTPSGAP